MTISELILKLERIRDEHGNLPVYQYRDGEEREPALIVTDTGFFTKPNYEVVEVKLKKRVQIR